MKKLLTAMLVLAAVVVLACSVVAYAEAVPVTVVSDDNSWANATWDADTKILTNVDGGYAFNVSFSGTNATLWTASSEAVTAEAVTIPSSFVVGETTYNVTNLGKYFLSGGSKVDTNNVKSVVISNGVTTINDEAFRQIKSLESVVIPDSVKSIGAWSFTSTGLTSLTIPVNVESIGKGAFNGTGSLVDVNILSTKLAWIPDEGFRYSGLVSINIPTNVTGIGNNVFQGCSKLTTINGSSEVFDLSFVTNSIGSYSFQQAGALSGEFIINAKTIGKECFKQTGAVTKFTWGENVQSISSGLQFRYDWAITEMVFLGKTAPAIDSNSFGNTNAFTIYYPAVSTGYDAAGYLTKTCVAVGGHISALADDGADTTVTYTVVELTQSPAKAAVVAIYDNGVMIGAKIVPVNAEGVNDAQTAIFTGVTGADSAKIYVWNSITSAKPLYESFEYVAPVEDPAA